MLTRTWATLVLSELNSRNSETVVRTDSVKLDAKKNIFRVSNLDSNSKVISWTVFDTNGNIFASAVVGVDGKLLSMHLPNLVAGKVSIVPGKMTTVLRMKYDDLGVAVFNLSNGSHIDFSSASFADLREFGKNLISSIAKKKPGILDLP